GRRSARRGRRKSVGSPPRCGRRHPGTPPGPLELSSPRRRPALPVARTARVLGARRASDEPPAPGPARPVAGCGWTACRRRRSGAWHRSMGSRLPAIGGSYALLI
ncbi:MAG: hypothetical protein AVDCRST_MAG19-3061, partial [uncultured Thermomicrobiales bacterium]